MKNLLIFIGLVLFSLNSFAGVKDTLIQKGNTIEYTARYSNGNLKEIGHYNLQKQRSGYWATYFENGNVMIEARFKDNKKHGEWRHYSSDGKLIAIIQYKRNKVKDYVIIDEEKGLLASDR